MKDYQKCYKMYCEAKKDIDEEPLDYEDWFVLEKEAEQEYKEVLKICKGRKSIEKKRIK